MAYTVELMPRARRQLARGVAWWRAERSAAPDLLRVELARAISNLETFPELGRSVGVNRRILLLPRTGTFVIYRIKVALETLEILRLEPARKA